MWEQINGMLRAATLRMTENVAEFLPGVVGLLLIVFAAAILALVARAIVVRALRGLQFDQRAEHLGLGTVADWSAVGGLSQLLARVVMWTIIVAGLLAGLSALDAALPEEFARSVLAYLPRIAAALLILVLGAIASRFLARTVLIGAVNLQFQGARLVSTGVKWLVLLLAWTIALEHLGIGRGLLTLAFGILFGGVVLALALAVGLGSKDLVRRALDKSSSEPKEPSDRLTHV